MSFLIRNKVPKLIFGRYIGMSLDGQSNGLILNCATRQIVTALKTRLSNAGVTVGNTRCVALYINNLTGSTQAECYTTAIWLRLQALGISTGNNACLTGYLSNLTGEN